uniref:Uncharacterized protein n=1 Tax=Ficedula albicollis TaxID=59894 RepID=A0A803WEA9_FICAL
CCNTYFLINYPAFTATSTGHNPSLLSELVQNAGSSLDFHQLKKALSWGAASSWRGCFPEYLPGRGLSSRSKPCPPCECPSLLMNYTCNGH